MSALDAHAQAARIMGRVFGEAAEDCGDEGNALLLARLSWSYTTAAERMEAEIRGGADANAREVRCTIDHATLKVPRCPACGAPRTGR